MVELVIVQIVVQVGFCQCVSGNLKIDENHWPTGTGSGKPESESGDFFCRFSDGCSIPSQAVPERDPRRYGILFMMNT
jgi:hypothetical protein